MSLWRIARALPEAVGHYPEVFIWAYQQWHQHDADDASRPCEYAARTQLFTDANLTKRLLDPMVASVRALDTSRLVDVQILDPACGTGALLLYLFRSLLPILEDRVDWSRRRAVAHLMGHTLRGLEIDAVCAQTCALVLALEARSALALGESARSWQICAHMPSPVCDFESGGAGMDSLCASGRIVAARYQRLGALIQPNTPMETAAFETPSQPVGDITGGGHISVPLAAPRHLPDARTWLCTRYTYVCTNVPFLARGKQPGYLREFCAEYASDARYDLANAFLDRCLDLSHPDGGGVYAITPQNWLFLAKYEPYRRRLLRQHTWHHIAFLGEGAFQSAAAAGAFAIIAHLHPTPPHPDHQIRIIPPPANAATNGNTPVVHYAQRAFLTASKARITPHDPQNTAPPLSTLARAYVGLQTGDDPRYIRAFWELEAPYDEHWQPLLGTPSDFATADGDSWLVRWDGGRGSMHASRGARPHQGQGAIGQPGIAIHRMRRIFAYRYTGQRFHQNIAVIVPHRAEDLDAITTFCRDGAFETAVRRLDPKLNVTNGTLTDVPFDLSYWKQRARTTRDPIANPHPFRQRSFVGGGPPDTALHVHLARYLGMRWPSDPRPPLEPDAPWYLRVHARSTARDAHDLSAWWTALAPLRGHAAYDDRALELTDINMCITWIRTRFFAEHCAMFLQRPFLWHIWDGQPDGFGLIVRYHRLSRAGLRTLIDGELVPWLSALEDGRSGDAPPPCLDDASRTRLHTAGSTLYQRLQAIYDGTPPFDLYIRWKSPADQPRGWAPDLDDGVRLNLRPFLSGESLGSAHAGVLRIRPHLHYRCDRGSDEPDGPWAHHNLADGKKAGARINDRHRPPSSGSEAPSGVL